MAIQETIKTGRKYRKCIDNTPGSKKWERYSFWTKSTDVEFSDGTTAESKLGSYKGVTTNENQVAGYAADVTLVKTIKTSLSNLITSLTNLVNSINDRLGGMRFYEDSTGKYVVGADSVPKKLGSVGSEIQIIQVSSGTTGNVDIKPKYENWSELTIANFSFGSSIGASMHGPLGQVNSCGKNINLSYSSTTGVLSINYNYTGDHNQNYNFSLNPNVYLYVPKQS